MNQVQQYIESGILDSYVAGLLSLEEKAEVEAYAAKNQEVRDEIQLIEESLSIYAEQHSKKPDPTVKAFLMATVDFMERLQNGEQPEQPPILNEQSSILDYLYWIQRPAFTLPGNFDGLFARIINATPEVTTAVVWIKEMAPQEVHHKEYEKFLILEGSCIIDIEGDKHALNPGDYLSIPLYKNHLVKVTSIVPCKVILQRIAA